FSAASYEQKFDARTGVRRLRSEDFSKGFLEQSEGFFGPKCAHSANDDRCIRHLFRPGAVAIFGRIKIVGDDAVVAEFHTVGGDALAVNHICPDSLTVNDHGIGEPVADSEEI